MYKLLIVDNEHIVVDSLLHYFENNVSEQLEAISAYSAREALQIMEREKVDILLTDIRMPGMDGLQLQQEVSRHWPWCRTLFLTGFNDFEYIQAALRGGGDDYLLKTEGNEAVLRAVLRVVEALDHQIEIDKPNVAQESAELLAKVTTRSAKCVQIVVAMTPKICCTGNSTRRVSSRSIWRASRFRRYSASMESGICFA